MSVLDSMTPQLTGNDQAGEEPISSAKSHERLKTKIVEKWNAFRNQMNANWQRLLRKMKKAQIKKNVVKEPFVLFKWLEMFKMKVMEKWNSLSI
jgi:hypothetical protein